MGSPWLLEYRPAVVPAPAGHFRSVELLFQMQSNQVTREIVQEGIKSPPDAAFLKDILGA